MPTRFRQSLWAAVIVLLVLLSGVPSVRAEEYSAPTFENILKALVRFGALNIRNDQVIDNYAIVTECRLYRKFFRDDFKWQEIREAMRKAIKQDVGIYPTGLYYNAKLQLDRYDFKSGMYKFTDRSRINGVDYFTFTTSRDNYCGGLRAELLPGDYRVVLDQPIIMGGIPMSEEDGKMLLARMEESKNARVIYARFNFRIVFVEKLLEERDKNGKKLVALAQSPRRRYIRLDANLGSIDFFEDEEHHKPIYSYRP